MFNVLDALTSLAPLCQTCHLPILNICTEHCCSKQALFCRECDSCVHFLHKTNELVTLFADPSRIRYESLDVGCMLDLFREHSAKLTACKAIELHTGIKPILVEVNSMLQFELQ